MVSASALCYGRSHLVLAPISQAVLANVVGTGIGSMSILALKFFAKLYSQTNLKTAYKVSLELAALVMSGGTTLLPWLIDRYWNDTIEVSTIKACQLACQYAATFSEDGTKIDSTSSYPEIEEEESRTNYSVIPQTIVAATLAVGIYSFGYKAGQYVLSWRDSAPDSETSPDAENPAPNI